MGQIENMLKALPREEINPDLCQSCQKNHTLELHPCPFAVEIWEDDSPCNCCDDCIQNCGDDI